MAKQETRKGTFASYANGNQFGKNKIRKLQSHLAKHPTDATAAQSLATHKNAVVVSPRWGYKRTSTLSASQRLHNETTSSVVAGQRQLRYALKHTNALVLGTKLVSDQIIAAEQAAMAE